jgi:hypothetical protein
MEKHIGYSAVDQCKALMGPLMLLLLLVVVAGASPCFADSSGCGLLLKVFNQ